MLSVKKEYEDFSVVFLQKETNAVLHKLLKNLSESEKASFYAINPKYFNISSENPEITNAEITNAKKRNRG